MDFKYIFVICIFLFLFLAFFGRCVMTSKETSRMMIMMLMMMVVWGGLCWMLSLLEGDWDGWEGGEGGEYVHTYHHVATH